MEDVYSIVNNARRINIRGNRNRKCPIPEYFEAIDGNGRTMFEFVHK